MIPILFHKEDTDFTTNGVGRLTECLSCVVTEEINGIYECEFQYPIGGRWYMSLINHDYIIATIHDHNNDVQAFDIYRYSAPINGIVTFYARHISYRLKYQLVGAVTPDIISNTWYVFNTMLVGPPVKAFAPGRHFSFVDNANYTTGERPALTWQGIVSARELLFTGYRTDDEFGIPSIIKAFPGEFKWDNFTGYYYRRRGSYNGVQIRYGKNMTEINREKDVSGLFTGVLPFWSDKNNPNDSVMGSIVSIAEPDEDDYVIPLDLTEEFKTTPTTAQLTAKANSYLTENNAGEIQDSITVDMVDLYDTNPDLEKITLGDYVDVIYTGLGVVAEQVEVISATFDALAERFTEIQCGQFPTTYAEVITGMVPSGGSSGGGGSTITVDDALSSTSTNPVQNLVINAALNAIPEMGGTASNGYIKFPSGLLICYGYITKMAVTGDFASWAGGMRCDWNNIGHYFTVPFLSQPVINATISGLSNGNATVVRCTASNVSINRLQFFGNGYTTADGVNYTFDYLAIGRWK